MEKIVEDRKEDYYLALRHSQKERGTSKEDISTWMGFFLDILIEQTYTAQDILNRKNIEDELSENQLEVLRILKSKKPEWSVKEIVEATAISRNTVKKGLKRLHDLKLITPVGLGRASRWKTV